MGLSHLSRIGRDELKLGLERNRNLRIMRTLSRKAVAASAFPPMLILSLAVGRASLGYAQTQAQPDAPTKVTVLHDPLADGTGRYRGATGNPPSASVATLEPA